MQQILLSRAFAREGADVRFLVPAKAGRSASCTDDGIGLHPEIMPAKGPKFLRALPPLLSMLRSLRRINADIYQTWMPGRGSSTMALYCRIKRIPYIYAIMSNMDLDGTNERKLGRLDRWLYHFAIRHAALVTAETQHELELLQERFGLKGMLVRNLCPVPDDADAGTERNIILWVGSFRDLKRPHMFAELARRIPTHDFVMIGGPFGSNPELFNQVAEKAEKLPNLKLTGQLQSAEMRPYYRKAIALALTSEVEGFPNVILEAWREGTPVVSTFDPDGMLTEHNLGYYAEDIDGLEAGLRRLIDDMPTRVAMGRRAIEYVRENHDPKSLARQVIQAVCQLVRKPMEVQV